VLTASFIIPANHPSLSGHFPGHPITPGVVSLDNVVRGLLDQLQGVSLAEVPQVKFMRPLLPEVEINVTYDIESETLYRFSCKHEELVVLSGKIKLVFIES